MQEDLPTQCHHPVAVQRGSAPRRTAGREPPHAATLEYARSEFKRATSFCKESP